MKDNRMDLVVEQEVDLSLELAKKLSNPKLSEDLTVDDFFDEFNVAEESRTNFGFASILDGANKYLDEWESEKASKEVDNTNQVLEVTHKIEISIGRRLTDDEHIYLVGKIESELNSMWLNDWAGGLPQEIKDVISKL